MSMMWKLSAGEATSLISTACVLVRPAGRLVIFRKVEIIWQGNPTQNPNITCSGPSWQRTGPGSSCRVDPG